MHRLRQGRSRGTALISRGTPVAVAVAALVVAADQWTKAYVLSHDGSGVPHHLFGPLGLRVGRNRGVAFSLLTGHSTAALVVTLCLTVLVVLCVSRAATPVAGVALGLLLGGAIGNDVDRIVRAGSGGVVDFLTLPHFATFNVADAAISCAVVLLVVLVLLRRPVLSLHRR